MIVKKINPKYIEKKITSRKEPINKPAQVKKLCLLSTPPKLNPDESVEAWAMKFLEKIGAHEEIN